MAFSVPHSPRVQIAGALTTVLLAVVSLLVAAPALAAGFSISGTVTYEGEALKRYPLRMDADPNCAAIYEGKRILSRDSLIGEGGAVENVFVYVKEAPEGSGSETPQEAVRLEQRGCLYTPRVIGVRVEQDIEIVNDDPTLHNVRALAKMNRPFNIGQPARGTRTKSFRAPEKPIKVKCDVHPWMAAFVFVMEHPFHSTTGGDGEYRIEGLPAGAYELVFWHEKLGEQVVEVDVAADVENLDLTFEGSE